MRLVFVGQRVDADHPGQGFLVRWLEGLARRTDLEVIAPAVGRHALGLPVHDLGKGRGRGRLALGAAYVATLGRVLGRFRPDVIFGHKCPRYALLALPQARLAGARVAIWHAHYRLSPTLRAAVALVDRVFTTVEREFPLWGPHCRAIGHGIDVERFRPDDAPPPSGPLRLLFLARFTPIKGATTLLEAARLLREAGDSVEITLAGSVNNEREAAHLAEIRRRHADLGLGATVRIVEDVPHPAVPDLMRRHDAFVDLLGEGGKGKSVLEAMSAGLPVLLASPAYRDETGGDDALLRFRAGDAADLAARVRALAALAPADRRAVGLRLRARVVERHSLETFLDRLVGGLEEIVRRSAS